MTNNPQPHTLRALITDFSAAPFRLLFLSACLSAAFAALCWPLAMSGYWYNQTDPLNLHAFLFLQSFAGAAFAGFLLTAVPEWTHYTPRLTGWVQVLWGLWLLASLLAPFFLFIALLIMVFFWLILCAQVATIMWRQRDNRHLSVLGWIIAVMLMTGYILITSHPDKSIAPFLWQQLVHVITLGIALISFRIARALGEQALEDSNQQDSRFIPNPYYKNLAAWLFYALIISNLLLQDSLFEGWISLAAGSVMVGRLREWHYSVLLKQHYIRWLYLTLFLLGSGYIWRGTALITQNSHPLLNPVLPFHLIAIGGFLLMAFQVFCIAGLRHSNCPLHYPTSSRLALLFIMLAALSRSVITGLGYHYLLFSMFIPGILTAAAFLIYLPVFSAIFLQNEAVFPAQKTR